MVVPNSLPYIIAGLRLAIGRAVLGVVVAEFFGSESGLGVMMVQAASRYQVDIVFAGLIVFAVLSLLMTGLVQLLEKRLSRWRPQPPAELTAIGTSRRPGTDSLNALQFVWPLELGRDVAHLLERRIEQVARQELLRIGQRLVLRPLVGRDHVERRDSKISRNRSFGISAPNALCSSSQTCRRPCRRRRRDAP